MESSLDRQQARRPLPATSPTLGERPDLLWVCVADSGDRNSPGALERVWAGELSPLARSFARYCDVRPPQLTPHPHRVEPQATNAATKRMPEVLVFEYDYPDMASLKLLRQAREHSVNLPIIIFTLYHSEELAIWALRNRVWDFFIKPLAPQQIHRIAMSLQRWHRVKVSGLEPEQFISNVYPDELRLSPASGSRLDVTLADNYLSEHCAESFTEQDLASLFGMSRFQFSREFKKASGQTFQNYVTSFRIERAKMLLTKKGVLIADVASAVGFGDPAYFTRVFTRVVGISPSSYRDNSGRRAGAN